MIYKPPEEGEKPLSTPHGALGTLKGVVMENAGRDLSTPHGALGTVSRAQAKVLQAHFQLHTVH